MQISKPEAAISHLDQSALDSTVEGFVDHSELAP